MRTYLFEYDHDGHTWAIEITADSPEDAWARLQKIGEHARHVGRLHARIPAFGPNIFADFGLWVVGVFDSLREHLRGKSRSPR